MDNHVHLAIQVADTPLSRIMQNLSFRYTRWINSRQHKAGRNYSAPLVFCPQACVAAMLESSHITHMRRILRIRRLAREQNPRGAE